MVYQLLRQLFPLTSPPSAPQRIVFIRPCCIGDVVMATAALTALREAYPRAHITWAVGPWSAPAIAHHPAIDKILITNADMPLNSPITFSRFVRQLRADNYDLAISLVRSPLMSLTIFLAGIPYRAGLDSGGRGFGYNLPVSIDPEAPEYEGKIYLKVVSAIAGRDMHAFANVPVTEAARATILAELETAAVESPFIVGHPGGGLNPGMRFESKRFPPRRFAEILNRIADAKGAGVILLGGPGDAELATEVARHLEVPSFNWVNRLSFAEIGALAAEALLYIGNDTGLTHLAAASGAKTVMLMGPTDPRRYAPDAPDSMVVWIPSKVGARGVAGAQPKRLDWQDIGVHVAVAVAQILDFLND